MATTAVKRGGGNGHPMLTGILIGLVLGVGISAGVAVWVARMPNPFQNRALEGQAPSPPAGLTPAAPPPSTAPAGAAGDSTVAPAGTAATAPPAGGAAASAPTAAGTGAPAGSAAAGAAGSAGETAVGPPSGTSGAATGGASAGTGAKPLETGTATLQVGAFANEDDALRQVETIAQVTGARARVVAPDKPDHPIYRVRIGPVQRGSELNDLVEALKANGISSTVVRAPGADAPRPSSAP